MTRIALALCALGLVGATLGATPAEASQALGYKIGQLEIQELRAYVEKEPGQKMDLRAFSKRMGSEPQQRLSKSWP